MKKPIFSMILLWALAQAYLILGVGFVANSFMFSEWQAPTRYFLFMISTVVTAGFVTIFTQRK